MDFTVKKYRELLAALQNAGYSFQTYEEFSKQPEQRSIVLRHDVDLLPYNSLRFAEIQHEAGVKGTYYFRAVPESWDEKVILAISKMGHEIGYHYECLTTCKGNMEKAMQDFEKNLKALRQLAPVSTLCMHGSPMSPFDSKDLWKDHDYRNFDLIAEPYFDVDFKTVFYLTDTGRRWDGDKVSVRDKVENPFGLTFHRTNGVIQAAQSNVLPDQIMFTFHPQRWNDNFAIWIKELLLQNVKNMIKRLFFVKKSK